MTFNLVQIKITKLMKLLIIPLIILFFYYTTSDKHLLQELQQNRWEFISSEFSNELSKIIKDKDINNIDSYETELKSLMEKENLNKIQYFILYKTKYAKDNISNNPDDILYKWGKVDQGRYNEMEGETLKNNQNQIIYYRIRPDIEWYTKLDEVLRMISILGIPIISIIFIGVDIIKTFRKRLKVK